MSKNDTSLLHHHAIHSLPTPAPSPPPSAPVVLHKVPSFMTLAAETTPPHTPPPCKPRKSHAAVIQTIISDFDGRDKSIKILQYLLKVLLHHRLINAKRWSPTASQFSTTRKILRLGHVIGPLRELTAGPKSMAQFALLLVTITNEISDDIFCCYKLGLVNSKIGKKVEILSMYCWFIGILADLRESGLKVARLRAQSVPDDDDEKNQQHQEKILIAQVSTAKLLMDGIFCGCDIWQPPHADSLQVWAGFCSGLLSGYKIWKKFSD